MSSNSKRLGRKCDILIGLCDQELIAVVGEKNRNNDMSSLALRCQKKIQFRCAVASVAKSKKKRLFLIRHNNTLQLACKYHYTVHISHGPLKLWKKKEPNERNIKCKWNILTFVRKRSVSLAERFPSSSNSHEKCLSTTI